MKKHSLPIEYNLRKDKPALMRFLKEMTRRKLKQHNIQDSDYTIIDTDELTKLKTWEIQSVETIQDKEAAIQELTARLDKCKNSNIRRN